MKVSTNIITFRIDVDFEGADVDMVYKEVEPYSKAAILSPIPSIFCDKAKIKVDKKKLSKTPISATIDFSLAWLAGFVDRNQMCTTHSKWESDTTKMITATTKDGFKYSRGTPVKTELEELGISVESWYGLMMGTCHLICEVDISIYNSDLVKKANGVVEKVFKRFVKYYK